MQPKLSVVILFFLIACIIFVLGFFGDSVIKFFEGFKIEPEKTGDSYLFIGTPQEVLSLQVSKGEIKRYQLFERDGSDSLPKEFILLKKEECDEKK